jgi:putative oxidoreductase
MNTIRTTVHSAPSNAKGKVRAVNWQRLGILYARIALAVAFLSGIADRFGLYWGRNVGSGNFDGFMRYTAKVNSFMPAFTIPFLAWAATVAELFFGIALMLGIWHDGWGWAAPRC